MIVSADNGSHWTQMNDGLPQGTDVLAFTTQNDTLYAGTGNLGVWKLLLSALAVSGKKVMQPSGFECSVVRSGNYPGAGLSAELTLIRPEILTMTVFDVQGAIVSGGHASLYSAGRHRVSLVSMPVKPGLYLLKMRTGRVTQVRHFTVID